MNHPCLQNILQVQSVAYSVIARVAIICGYFDHVDIEYSVA